MAATPLNGAVLGSVATSTGNGYWMVGSDGGIFSFGDAKFFGSTGNITLNKPVMSMAPDPDGAGYWLVASDGGIFAFDAPFKGSMGSTPLNKPVSGMVPGTNGYMMVGEDGGIFSFGDVAFLGSLGATPPSSPITAVSLWVDPTFQPAGQPVKPAPVYEWVTIYGPEAGTADDTSQVFTVTGESITVLYQCDPNGANPHVSCWFRLTQYPSGDYVDGWNLSAANDGSVRDRIIAVEPGQHVMELSPSSDSYIWGFSVLEQRCTANCN